MKFFFHYALLFCYVGVLQSQSPIDSLTQIWQDETQADTTRLAAAKLLSTKHYLYTQPDSALYWAEEAYVFAEEKEIRTAMGVALQVIGVVHKNAGDLDKAIDYLERSLDIREELKEQSGILRTASSLANVYARKFDYANAINYDLRCLKIAEQLGDDFYLTGMLNNIGTAYLDVKDYENAITYFNRALEIHKQTKQERCLALEGLSLLNIGSLFFRNEEEEKALEYFQKALIVNEKYDRKDFIATNHFSLGEVYFHLDNIEQAKYHFTKSLALHRKSNDAKAVALCLSYFGRIYQYNKPDSSLLLTKEALSLAQEAEAVDAISEAAKVLSQLHETKGEYQQALGMHKLFRDMQDSVSSETNQNAVLRAEYQYIYDKKKLQDEIEQEQKVREQQLRLQRERFILLGGTALFLLLIGFYIKSRYQRNLAEREKLLHEIELLKERLATQSVTKSNERKELSLNKSKIEAQIDNKLGESSWRILNLIFQNPSISNKQLAEAVHLSLEGVSSSLRRMYVAFDINSVSNKKIALIMKAVRISLDN